MSDRRALETLAERRGRDLQAEGVAVVSMGGSKNIRRFMETYGPQGRDLRLAGLVDAGEEGDFQRALERAGLGADLSRLDMEALGFYVCVADLEDELIRALGAARSSASSRRGRPRVVPYLPAPTGAARADTEAHLRRFMGTHSGRKIEYAALLVDALDLDRVPRPLDRVLAHV